MDRYRIRPGTKVDLAKLDPRDESAFSGDKVEAKQRIDDLTDRLEQLQEVLYAEGKRRVLVVLQAMDTGGKDGVIRNVLDGVNPQGVKVTSFKQPVPTELAHDFLWRVHPCVPGNGEMVIFNRSHYEDVLVVRVHELVPEERWRKRYEHIVAFEKLLADEGTTILKFYLHISKDEQKQRLQARLDEPDKHWKFRHGDLTERKLWSQYMAAYEEAIERTSTKVAPWYVVPADRKWYRDLVILEILTGALEALRMEYPQVDLDSARVRIE